MTRIPVRLVATALAAALLAIGLPARPAGAKLIENLALNYVVDLPEGWVEDPPQAGWQEAHIVFGAIRVMERLKGGKPADGQGGWVHLAIQDAPPDKDVDALAADPEVRAFLLNRFATDRAAWPAVEIEQTEFEGGPAIRILQADGTSPNLKRKPSPTRATLLITIVQQKLYKLRMYAWHTEYDDEGLKSDLDMIEVNFDVPDKAEKAKPPQEAPPDEEGAGDSEDAPQGDEEEEKVYENKALGWRLVKPKGIKSFDWDKDKYEDVVAWFEGNKAIGSYQVILYVIRRGKVVEGRQVPDMNLRSWAFDKWWAPFTAAHPEGPVWTYKWPKKSKSFITLPDFEAGEVVVLDEGAKRPIEADSSDLIKKLKVAEKVDNTKIGEEKTIEAYRAVIGARRPHVGKEMIIRYTWGTSQLTCMLVVGLTRDAHGKWAEPLTRLLESLAMLDT